jgi:hypothetical protein
MQNHRLIAHFAESQLIEVRSSRWIN